MIYMVLSWAWWLAIWTTYPTLIHVIYAADTLVQRATQERNSRNLASIVFVFCTVWHKRIIVCNITAKFIPSCRNWIWGLLTNRTVAEIGRALHSKDKSQSARLHDVNMTGHKMTASNGPQGAHSLRPCLWISCLRTGMNYLQNRAESVQRSLLFFRVLCRIACSYNPYTERPFQ